MGSARSLVPLVKPEIPIYRWILNLPGAARYTQGGIRGYASPGIGDSVPDVKPVEPRLCKLDSCDVVFTPTGRSAHLRQYCDEHFVGSSGKGNVNRSTRSVGAHCPVCSRKLGPTKHKLAIYCGLECQAEAAKDRKAHRDQVQADLDDLPDDVSYKIEMRRKGKIYLELKRRPELVRKMLAGSISQVEAAGILETTQASVSRSLAAIRYELAQERGKSEWIILPENQAMVPVALLDRLIEIGPDHPDVEGLVDQCADAFWVFQARFFTVGSKQAPFIIKDFHREILKGMIDAYCFGSRLLVLTPPRHGKSELVIRFAAWLIVMYPNIQILWVAANKDLAIQMTSKLKATFEWNKEMRECFLAPGEKYGDKGCDVWQKHEFTLYTRTDKTLKSPTFTGLGSTSTVAGRDTDFIGIDDLEERKTVATPELREKSRMKHSEIMERQEGHTGVVTIGSRQHPDDIPNHLMEQDGEDRWNILVYPAHDEIGCQIDPELLEGHTDCMLMPEIRSYRWMVAMEMESVSLGLPGRFPLRYLQQPVPEEGIVFDIPLIRELCLDRSRGLGMGELPPMRLIAGLDPAARGTQVAFLWGWDGTTLHMIDFVEDIGGGVMKAVEAMETWDDEYELKLWFHEDNSGQIDAWRHVPEYRRAQETRSLIVKPHTTGMNKHDPESGVSSMALWYHRGAISLPYATAAARLKTKRLLGQLQNWTSDGFSKKGKTDIKMAHWLPFPTVVKWMKEERAITLHAGADASYPGISRLNDVGWSTPYPGGK